MQNTVADGLAVAASHPITVQVINQGAGIRGNVATGLITGLLTGGDYTDRHLADAPFHAQARGKSCNSKAGQRTSFHCHRARLFARTICRSLCRSRVG